MSGEDYLNNFLLNETFEGSSFNGDNNFSGFENFDDSFTVPVTVEFLAIHKIYKIYFEVVIAMQLILKVIGVIGNLLIICYFAIQNKKNLRKMSTYHFLLLLLAVVDFLVCVMELPSILMELMSFSERFFEFVTLPFHELMNLQSMFGLFFVSLFRYQSIVHPFKPKWTKIRYFFTYLISLIISFLFFTPHLLERQKIINLHEHSLLVSNTVISLLFLETLIIMYYKMSKVLEESQESRSKERTKKALKTLRNLVLLYAVSLVFTRIILVCIQILIPADFYMQISESGFFAITLIENIAFEMTILNNVGNFFIYLKMMPEFRHFMRNLLCCGCNCNTTKQN